jgi:hypothetical protein
MLEVVMLEVVMLSEKDKCALVCFAILLFGSGILLGAMLQDMFSQRQAVKHGAARYSPETGYFQWLDEVEK